MPNKKEDWRKKYAKMKVGELRKEQEAIVRKLAEGKTAILYEKYQFIGELLTKK